MLIEPGACRPSMHCTPSLSPAHCLGPSPVGAVDARAPWHADCAHDTSRVSKKAMSVWSSEIIMSVMCAEAQQYRERIRKAKQHVYEMYLWRKDLMQDYRRQVDYMRSPEWDQIFSEKIRRCSALSYS